MARTAVEAREQIVADLARAIDHLAIASSALSDAYELLDETTGDVLEGELYRPVQRGFGRAKRTYSGFADRFGLATRAAVAPPPGAPSQGVARFVERAVNAVEEADRAVAELQDSMLPIEAGDAELRAGLGEVRELIAPVPRAARQFTRTLGR